MPGCKLFSIKEVYYETTMLQFIRLGPFTALILP
jgi:hypothetical protein